MTNINQQSQRTKTPSKFVHKRTGVQVQFIESNNPSSQYVGIHNDINLPRWAVEKSNDWELIDDSKKYTIGQIRDTFTRVPNYQFSGILIEDFIKVLRNG